MPNTYTQVHIHVVFAVKFRNGLIASEWKQELYRYITGIIQHYRHKVLAINGMPDHIHILFGMRPSQSLSDLMQDIKGSSSKWINEKKFSKHRFEWQQGYAAFSYSRSQVQNVIAYIENQEKHHEKKNFISEYRNFLQKFEIDFRDEYLFTEPV